MDSLGPVGGGGGCEFHSQRGQGSRGQQAPTQAQADPGPQEDVTGALMTRTLWGGGGGGRAVFPLQSEISKKTGGWGPPAVPHLCGRQAGKSFCSLTGSYPEVPDSDLACVLWLVLVEPTQTWPYLGRGNSQQRNCSLPSDWPEEATSHLDC